MRPLLLFVLLMPVFCIAQNKNAIWVFGDSTGLNFSSSSNPLPINTANESRGSCTSISDSYSNLLFYAYTPHVSLWQSGYTKIGVVKNNNDSIIQGGDSLIGGGWYHEMLIIPFPDDTNLFYLFYVGVTHDYGLWYSIIDISQNAGQGAVTQKNIQLQSFPMVDCLTAVKHGNGRDWWLVFRRWYIGLTPTNEFFTYLITPSGITNFNTQNIGSTHAINQGQLTFSNDGSKLVYTNGQDKIEMFSFDRCTGLLSNPIVIQQEAAPQFVTGTWSSAFSPNDSLLYVSTSYDTTYLYQLNLKAPNILASRIYLDTMYKPPISGGALKLAPDGKIYFSCAYDNGMQFNYPYDDSVYNYVNMNLSVINFPDSPGTACGYAPFSFYLGGKRTYYGLPNNPDYDLPRLQGSPCDTIKWTGIKEQEATGKGQLYVTYINAWDKLFINAQHLKGKQCLVQVYDITGQKVFETTRQTIAAGYFTFNFNCSVLSHGMYVVSLRTEKEILNKKFVKN